MVKYIHHTLEFTRERVKGGHYFPSLPATHIQTHDVHSYLYMDSLATKVIFLVIDEPDTGMQMMIRAEVERGRDKRPTEMKLMMFTFVTLQSLREVIPHVATKGRRLSKLETLTLAKNYIVALTGMVRF